MNPGTFLINGNVVRPEERVKLLGAHLHSKLNFGHHVSHICQKAGLIFAFLHLSPDTDLSGSFFVFL